MRGTKVDWYFPVHLQGAITTKTKATQEENSSKPNKNNHKNKPKEVVIANQSMGD